MSVCESFNYVNGNFLKGESDKELSNFNPSNGELISKINYISESQLDYILDSSDSGQKLWASYSANERARILRKVSDLIKQNRMKLAELESIDAGKPICETPEADIDSGADCFEYYASIAQTMNSEHIKVDGGFAYTTREPVGGVFAIGAWNYPFQIACWKAAPALATGNSVIFKPAEATPTTAVELAKIMTQAGVPDGVFNVIFAKRDIAEKLCSEKRIAKVSLTGSVETGKKVMAQCSSTLKHLTMELGGKSTLIIFDDADLELAAELAINANFYTQGEICTNGTRVFIHEDVYEKLVEMIKARTESINVGAPLDPKTDMGSLIDSGHMENVLNYIKIGIEEGANLLTGGERLTHNGLDQGNFMTPAVFTNCTDSMTIVKEEIFGPVMSILKFKNEEEVICRANNSDFGLAAGVVTENISRAHRVCSKLEAGVCWVNNYNVTPINMPFGGVKMSGIGRENGWAAIENFTELKTVYVEIK